MPVYTVCVVIRWGLELVLGAVAALPYKQENVSCLPRFRSNPLMIRVPSCLMFSFNNRNKRRPQTKVKKDTTWVRSCRTLH